MIKDTISVLSETQDSVGTFKKNKENKQLKKYVRQTITLTKGGASVQDIYLIEPIKEFSRITVTNLEIYGSIDVSKKNSGLDENVNPNPVLLIQSKSSYQEVSSGYKHILKKPQDKWTFWKKFQFNHVHLSLLSACSPPSS